MASALFRIGWRGAVLRGAVPAAPLVVALVVTGACQRTETEDRGNAGRLADSVVPGGGAQTGGAANGSGDQAAAVETAAVRDTPAGGDTAGPGVSTGGSREPGDPEWMSVDAATKTVSFEIVASRTTANSNLNFNGYAKGEMTITVPRGWTVKMTFESRDANVPHSVYVIAEQPPYTGAMPETPAIPRAYSMNVIQGIAAGRVDRLRFPVPEAGKYVLACGVPGHATAGMWDWFVVSAEAERPSVTFAR